MTLQVLPSLVINALSLVYSASQFVTVKWCVPTHDEIDELRVSTPDDRSGSDLHHPLLQSDVDRDGGGRCDDRRHVETTGADVLQPSCAAPYV